MTPMPFSFLETTKHYMRLATLLQIVYIFEFSDIFFREVTKFAKRPQSICIIFQIRVKGGRRIIFIGFVF